MSLGDFELDVSPYEDAVTRKPWKMNLSKLNMLKPGVEGKLRLGHEGWAWTLKEAWVVGNTNQRACRGRVLVCQVAKEALCQDACLSRGYSVVL